MLAAIVHNYVGKIGPLSNAFVRFGHICMKILQYNVTWLCLTDMEL